MKAWVVVVAGLLAVVAASRGQVAGDGCGLPQLSAGEQALLVKYGVLRLKGQLVLDPGLVADCEERREVLDFLQHGVGGYLSVTDKLFAAKHLEEVNRVVLRVWPAIAETPAAPADGALYEEKWAMLLQEEITDETAVALVSRNVKEKGLGGDAAFLLFSRPLPELNELLQSVAVDARATPSAKIYAAALISRYDPVRAGMVVRAVMEEKGLTGAERETARVLEERFRGRRPAKWGDLQVLSDSEDAGQGTRREK